MKKYYKILLFVLFSGNVVGQARLVFNSNPYVVLNGGTAGTPIHIVLGNSATNAITWTGSAQVNGGIISQGEHNKLQWNIGASTGTYSVPFTAAAAGPAIPVDFVISSAGTGAGNIKFSTYGSTLADNSTYMPSFVTNMASSSSNALPSNANNSERVMDRFWIINANGYNASAKPVGTMTLNYKDLEHSQSTNSITETQLQAQRWSLANSNWDGLAIQGTQAAGSYQGRVSGIAFTATDFEAAWVLVDNTAPLPVELTEFKGNCENGQRNLFWSTASETNNNFFTIEKSVDGITFIKIGTVTSLAISGNSVSSLHYSYVDKNNISGNYYRLKQTDFDGKFSYSSIIFNKCDDDDHAKPVSIDVYPSPSNGLINVLLTGYDSESVQIKIMNAVGQQIAERKVRGEQTTLKETFSLNEQAKGIYYVTIVTGKETVTKKIINQY